MVTSPKKKFARAGWLKRLVLVLATPRADFAVVCVQLCSIIIASAILPCVAYKKLLPLPDNRGLLPTPKETYDLNSIAVTLSIWSFRTPISIFCTKECTILPSS